MKKFFPLSFSLAAAIFFSAGCDYVALPNEGTTVDTTTTTVQRKVLVEDYTGHLCTNCPDAADSLHNIMTKYPGRVIPIAVHCGFFAKTRTEAGAPLPSCAGSNPSAFFTDHRSTVGDSWDAVFGMSAYGLPVGMINRSGKLTNQHTIDRTVWKDSVFVMLQRPADAQLTITPDYNTSTRLLNVAVKTKFLNSLSSTQGYALSVVLTEDGIVDWQNVHQNCVSNYEFDHQLRTGISGNTAQGTTLVTGNVAAGQEFTQNYTGVSINSAWIDTNCHIVAFVYNIDTWEVVQAEEINLR